MRVAAVQTTATSDRDANLAGAADLVDRAADAGARLVVLPEYFAVAGDPDALRSGAETLTGTVITWASQLASRRGIWLVAGSFPERVEGSPLLANTSCLVAPDGTLAAVYRKVHLFDVGVAGAGADESATFAPGSTVETAALGDGLPTVGLSICYDLRFPELYRALALRGADIVVVPAAFTAVTGPAHWEVLLRARAIEDQVFVIAAGQVGDLPAGMPACHGHSMIVDPWGTVLDEVAGTGPGMAVADLDFGAQDALRRELPVLASRRPAAYR